MSYYTSKERRLKDAAEAVLADPNASFDQLDKATRRLDQLAAKAAKRTKTQKPDEEATKPAWMTGYTPTLAQQAVIDQLLEDGQDHEAQVWFLVYQMEADPKAMEAANQ